MPQQQLQLQQWSSFFSIISGASATLLGLLFVVITISPAIGRKVAAKSKVYLTPAVLYLASVLIMSAVLTIPNQTQLSASICICLLGLSGLVYSSSLLLLAHDFYFRPFDRLRYAVVPFTAYAVMFSGGLLVLKTVSVSLDVVAAGMAMLLNSAIQNSWSIAISIISSTE